MMMKRDIIFCLDDGVFGELGGGNHLHSFLTFVTMRKELHFDLHSLMSPFMGDHSLGVLHARSSAIVLAQGRWLHNNGSSGGGGDMMLLLN